MPRWPVVVAALCLSGAALAQDGSQQASRQGSHQDAHAWLRQMSTASQSLNYRGTFVYLHQGRLEAMRIIHRAAEGGEQERLLALTGEAREVIRDKERVTCILPKSKAVMVDRSLPRKPFPAALPRDLGDLADNYEFLVQDEDRVSGLSTRGILIRPRDAFRYGYRLWLERDNGLLLKSELLDAAGSPVEQLMFTDIEVLDSVPDADLQPALQGEDYTRQRHQEQPPTARSAAPAENGEWTVAGLPPGFMLTHRSRHALPASSGEVEHLVFSDGLATVSVYIEPQSESGLNGASHMGAVNALGLRQGGHQITVVGEVPRLTVERIGASVQRRP